MQQGERKAGMIFLWIGIILVIFLLVLIYLSQREPREQLQNEAIAQQELITRVFSQAPLIGAEDAQITLIEFGDFQCPFCKEVSPILKEIRTLYPNQIRHLWINVLNPEHEQAQPAGIASFCANQQGRFWEYHDILFENQSSLGPALYNQIAQNLQMDIEQFQTCFASASAKTAVLEQNEFAKIVEVDATPYLLVNEEVVSGVFTLEELKTIIDREL